MKFKKYTRHITYILCFCVFTLSGLSNLAYAGEMGSTDMYSPYDGVYVGADIGLSNLLDKVSHVNASQTLQLGSLGIVGGGFIGYDYSISDRVKLGAEFFGQANGLNTSVQYFNPSSTYQLSSRYSLGVRVLPGYEFLPGAVGHVILGYSNTQFKIQDNGAYGFLTETMHKSGFQSGLGFLVAVTPSFLVRFDGTYTNFTSQSNKGLTATYPQQYQYYTNDFSLFSGELSVIYKFNS